MSKEGVEPSHLVGYQHLKLARLPFRHSDEVRGGRVPERRRPGPTQVIFGPREITRSLGHSALPSNPGPTPARQKIRRRCGPIKLYQLCPALGLNQVLLRFKAAVRRTPTRRDDGESANLPVAADHHIPWQARGFSLRQPYPPPGGRRNQCPVLPLSGDRRTMIAWACP